jgi:hypothetical protein
MAPALAPAKPRRARRPKAPTATPTPSKDFGPEYVKWYNRGWAYSNSPSGAATLDHVDSSDMGAYEASYDGYLDAAAGLPKWHSGLCRRAGKCAEHTWSERAHLATWR